MVDISISIVEMNKKNSTPGKKSTKREDKDFQHVLKTLETEKKALTPSQATINFFYATSGGVATIPIVLYATDLSYFLSYIVYFLIGIAGSAALLSMSYNIVANKTRKSLFIERSRDSTKDDTQEFFALVRHINAEAVSYALFTINLTFLVFFLVFALYLLRPYNIPSQFYFIASTTLPAAIAFGLSRYY